MSENSSRLGRNSLILAITEMLIKVFGIVATLIVARLLGAEQFGLLSFAYTLVGIALVLPDYGLGRLAVRELARNPRRAHHFLWHSSILKLILYIPAALICIAVIWFSSDDPNRLWLVLLVFVVEALRQHMVFFCAYFRAIQQTEWEAGVRLFLALFSFLFGVPALLWGFGIEGLMWVRFWITLLSLMLSVWFLYRFGLRMGRTLWRYLRVLLSIGTPMALFTFCIVIYMSVNIVVLGLVYDDETVGYYTMAMMIVMPLNIISDAITGAALPILSQYWENNNLAYRDTIRQTLRYLLLLVFPLSIGLFLLADIAIDLIFGEAYPVAIIVLLILAISLIPDYINTLLSTALIAQDQEQQTLNATIAGASVALLGCVFLIPPGGAAGAALSWLLAEITVFIYQISRLKGLFFNKNYAILGLRTFSAAIGMGCIIWGLQQIDSSLWLIFPSAIFSYTVLLWLFGEIQTADIDKLKQIIHNYR